MRYFKRCHARKTGIRTTAQPDFSTDQLSHFAGRVTRATSQPTSCLILRGGSKEARQDLAVWLKKWGKRYQRLCDWVEANIEETLTFYRLPRQHHKNMKSTNLLERLKEEIKRRTLVVRIFPNTAAAYGRSGRSPVEMHENWIEAIRYLNMEY